MMKYKQRAIAGLALTSLLFVMIQARECRAKEPSPWTRDHSDLKLDAFNMELCGETNNQAWQFKESAFGFKLDTSSELQELLEGEPEQDNRSDANIRPRIAHGTNVTEGEFPFFVKLSDPTEGGKGEPKCGGTLVHNNLVITAAHCVAEETRIELSFGSNKEIDGNATSELADKWCWLKPRAFFDDDLAVIRLAKPVAYKEGRIGPACLWPKMQHASKSICTLPGIGFTRVVLNDTTYKPTHPDTLQAKNFSRVPCPLNFGDSYSCYLSEGIGGTCSGDSGSPFVCYDRSITEQGVVNAFVVGALSKSLPLICANDKRGTSFMVDFHLLEEDLAGLLYEIQRDEGQNGEGENGEGDERFICRSHNGQVTASARTR